MNRIAVLALAVFLSVLVTGDCRAQDDPDGPELMTIDGKVVKVDAARSTITIKFANELTFSVPPNTPITEDVYNIRLSDIEPGDDVTVEHYMGPSGDLIATRVTVENKEAIQCAR